MRTLALLIALFGLTAMLPTTPGELGVLPIATAQVPPEPTDPCEDIDCEAEMGSRTCGDLYGMLGDMLNEMANALEEALAAAEAGDYDAARGWIEVYELIEEDYDHYSQVYDCCCEQ